jgi:DNA polymerase III sliding clamp (beta) subunit (PCNA family)
MVEIISKILSVAKYADTKSDLNVGLKSVQFRKGSVCACGHEGGASAIIDADVQALVDASALIKLCKAMPNAEISVVEPNKRSKSTRPRLQFRQGRSKATIETLPKSAAVKMPKPASKAAWSEVHGLNEIDRVAWAVGTDDSRRHMKGVHFGSGGMEASDGHACVVLSTPGDLSAEFGEDGILAPLSMFKGFPQVVSMTKDGNQLFIAEDPTVAEYRAVRLIDARFPPLGPIMEAVWKLPRMEIVRKDLEEMISQAKVADTTLVLSAEGQRLRVLVDQEVRMSLFDFEGSVPFEGEIPQGIIGLNAELLLPAVKSARSDKIVIHINPVKGGSLEPMGIVDGSYSAVMMPMRI